MTGGPIYKWDQVLLVLGACPLVAATTGLITGIAMGLVFLFSLVLLGLAVSALRYFISNELRLVVILLISATLVTLISLALQTWFYEFSLSLGFYVLLIAVNFLLITHVEEHAMQGAVLSSLRAGLLAGAGILMVLAAAGLVREVLGSGTLFQQADLIFGDIASDWKITLSGRGLSLFRQSPGAFLALGLILALINLVRTRMEPGLPA